MIQYHFEMARSPRHKKSLHSLSNYSMVFTGCSPGRVGAGQETCESPPPGDAGMKKVIGCYRISPNIPGPSLKGNKSLKPLGAMKEVL